MSEGSLLHQFLALLVTAGAPALAGEGVKFVFERFRERLKARYRAYSDTAVIFPEAERPFSHPYAKEIASHSDRVIKHAVKGMLPKTKLGAQMLTRLKVYAGPEHPHSAQVNRQAPKQSQDAAGSKPATGGA